MKRPVPVEDHRENANGIQMVKTLAPDCGSLSLRSLCVSLQPSRYLLWLCSQGPSQRGSIWPLPSYGQKLDPEHKQTWGLTTEAFKKENRLLDEQHNASSLLNFSGREG